MDFLQAWGAYAPTLLYFWISIAYGFAYFRTRKIQQKDQASKLLLITALILTRLFSFFRSPEDNPSTLWWVIYAANLCWPLVLLALFHGMRGRRNIAGYHHPIDVLLFRPPRSIDNDSPSDSARTLRQPYFRATLFLFLLTALLAGVSYIGVGLQTCGWLDIALERSSCLRSIAIDGETIESVAVSTDGSTLAAGGSEQVIRLFRVADGQLQRTLTGHTDWVTSVAFSSDRKLLASGSWDGTVRLWRIDDGTVVHVLPMPTNPGHKAIVVAFSPPPVV